MAISVETPHLRIVPCYSNTKFVIIQNHMDTKQLIKNISGKTGRSVDETEKQLDALINVFKERCAEEDSIAIPGFGTFEPRKRQERINIHPSSGKRILIPPKVVLTFKMSAIMKQKLRTKQPQ